MTNFNLKYLKYKKKYLELRNIINQTGGNKIMTVEELKKSTRNDTKVSKNTIKTIGNYFKDENVYNMFKNIIIEKVGKKDQKYYLDSLKFFSKNKLPPLIFWEAFKELPEKIIQQVLTVIPLAVDNNGQIIVIGNIIVDSEQAIKKSTKHAQIARLAEDKVRKAKEIADKAAANALKQSQQIGKQLSQINDTVNTADQKAAATKNDQKFEKNNTQMQAQINSLNAKINELVDKEKKEEKKEDKEKLEEKMLNIAEEIAQNTAEEITEEVVEDTVIKVVDEDDYFNKDSSTESTDNDSESLD